MPKIYIYENAHTGARVYSASPTKFEGSAWWDHKGELEIEDAEFLIPTKMIQALERIADPRNTHFAGDAQVVAQDALREWAKTGAETPDENLTNEDLALMMAQARYALKDYNRKQPGCGFDKLAEACAQASLRLTD